MFQAKTKRLTTHETPPKYRKSRELWWMWCLKIKILLSSKTNTKPKNTFLLWKLFLGCWNKWLLNHSNLLRSNDFSSTEVWNRGKSIGFETNENERFAENCAGIVQERVGKRWVQSNTTTFTVSPTHWEEWYPAVHDKVISSWLSSLGWQYYGQLDSSLPSLYLELRTYLLPRKCLFWTIPR